MGFLSNIASSVTGSVDKALLCVKRPKKADTASAGGGTLTSVAGAAGGSLGLEPSIRNVNLRAKLAVEKKSFLSAFTAPEQVARGSGYHVMQVKYNPNKIHFNAYSKNQMLPGPGGAGGNMQMQSTEPANITMQVELLFDDVNNQDAFMFEKFTNVSAGAIVSDVAGVVKNVRRDGYTVQREIEGMIALITQSETKQVVFYWGDMAFAGEVIAIDAKYTMFNPQGHPVRGTVTLLIQEGGPDSDGSGFAYWEAAYKKLMDSKGNLFDKAAGKAGNLLNLK